MAELTRNFSRLTMSSTGTGNAVSDANEFLKTTDLVPYIWFDLIARIVPGSAALFLFYRIRFQSPGVIEFAAVVVLIYLVGFFLEKISVGVHRCIHGITYKSIEKNCFEDLEKDKRSLSLWDLAYQVPAGGSLKVGKMLAELQLFKSLSILFLLYGLSLLVPLKYIPFRRLCIFTQQCGDLRRLLPGWPGSLLFLVLFFLVLLFARDHFKECCRAVKRYLNARQV